MLEQVELGLQTFLARESSRWPNAGRTGAGPIVAVAELIAAGGKRLRPAFLLSSYLAAVGRPDPNAVRAAMALESCTPRHSSRTM
ncbi:hypothetical protein [Streptomyces sp. HC307]|uniref:hypothetical protein n=1 Tax=Streptomyces flavusporus TaxID=3385496 RepID=UPI0039172BDE